MRRLTDPEAHRQRVDVIEGRYPEGLKARCSVCESVAEINEGAMYEITPSALGPSRVFLCSDCAAKADKSDAA
jgi:hypothetical protein